MAQIRGKCFWINAVSVGEAQAAVSFMKALRNEGITCPFLLSTTTDTGRKMALDLAGGNDLFCHIYAVWDKKEFVAEVLERIEPIAFATVETEIWPNILAQCRKRNIPTFLINGRISDRTWSKVSLPMVSHIAGLAFRLFDVITCRDEQDKSRLVALSVPADKIFVTGDSKLDELLRRKEQRQKSIAEVREKIASYFATKPKKLIIAGSTHSPEEKIVFEIFARLKNTFGTNVKFLSVPRHPERVAEVMEIAKGYSLTARRLSELEDKNSAPNDLDIIVVDKIGVLFDLYGASDIAFVGGSFVDKGGQNILEPLVWAVPTCYGPHMEDFAEPASYFEANGLSHRVSNAEELDEAFATLLQDGKSDQARAVAEKYFAEQSGTSTKLARIIKPILEVKR